MICRLIGVPDEDVETFVDWADALSVTFGFLTPEQAEAATTALDSLNGYVEGLLAKRRDAPGDDLVSALVLAEIEGDRLTHTEARTMVGNLIVGGHAGAPSWSEHHDYYFPTTKDVLDHLKLADNWIVVTDEVVERPLVGPDGQEESRKDNVLTVKRLF